MSAPLLGEVTVQGSEKSHRLSKEQRIAAAIALKANGLHNTEIADVLGLDRKTIHRYLDGAKDVRETVVSAIDTLNEHIGKLIKVEERAGKYAELAKGAKNEAVALAALGRIDDLAGIVTQKELVRTRRDEPREPAPMFQLAPGTTVNVSVTNTVRENTNKNGSIMPTRADVVESEE